MGAHRSISRCLALSIVLCHRVALAQSVSTTPAVETSSYTGKPEAPAPHAAEEEVPHAPAGDFGFARDEGFRLKSEDGHNLLRFGLQMALRIQPRFTSGDRELDAMIGFLRPILRGNLVKPWIGYRVSLEMAGGDPFVLDAHVDVQPIDELGIRVGQQGTPVSRHENMGPMQIFFPDFASVATYYWSGREKGVTLFGTVAQSRFDYYLGVYGGTPLREAVNIPNNYIGEARLSLNPLGPVNRTELPFTPEGEPLPVRLSFSVQGYYGRLLTSRENYNFSNSVVDAVPSILNQRAWTGGADAWFQGGPVIVSAEYYWRRLTGIGGAPSYDSQGVWGQVVVNAYKNLVGVGGRASWLDPNRDLGRDQAITLEGQIAWFLHAPELILKLRYGWIRQRSAGGDAIDPAQAARLPFAPGTTHLATLQLNLTF